MAPSQNQLTDVTLRGDRRLQGQGLLALVDSFLMFIQSSVHMRSDLSMDCRKANWKARLALA